MSLRSRIGWLRRQFIVKVKEVSVPYVIKLTEKNRFQGQVVIVTGGSGVIGRAICYRLACEGASVYVCGSRKETVEPVVKEITDAGYIAYPLPFSLDEESEIVAAFNQVWEKEHRLDLMVHCAGGGARSESKPLIYQSMEVIDRILKINLRAGIITTREAAKYMVTQKYGKIILIGSTVGVMGKAEYSEYAAAKAGEIAFVKSIAMELGKEGIRINCVCPGIVQRGSIDENEMIHINKTNVLNSYGKPEDISGMVAYLNSDEASFITGQNFLVEGGRVLGLRE